MNTCKITLLNDILHVAYERIPYRSQFINYFVHLIIHILLIIQSSSVCLLFIFFVASENLLDGIQCYYNYLVVCLSKSFSSFTSYSMLFFIILITCYFFILKKVHTHKDRCTKEEEEEEEERRRRREKKEEEEEEEEEEKKKKIIIF